LRELRTPSKAQDKDFPVKIRGRKMPIYEYRCSRCANEFELLVLRTSPVPACPSCESRDIEQLLSGFAVSSEGTRQAHLDKARSAHKASGELRDKRVAEVEYQKKEREEHGLA
jgi:putative FmdB family regulatory protein